MSSSAQLSSFPQEGRGILGADGHCALQRVTVIDLFPHPLHSGLSRLQNFEFYFGKHANVIPFQGLKKSNSLPHSALQMFHVTL